MSLIIEVMSQRRSYQAHIHLVSRRRQFKRGRDVQLLIQRLLLIQLFLQAACCLPRRHSLVNQISGKQVSRLAWFELMLGCLSLFLSLLLCFEGLGENGL